MIISILILGLAIIILGYKLIKIETFFVRFASVAIDHLDELENSIKSLKKCHDIEGLDQ